jgi:hypothetical protein
MITVVTKVTNATFLSLLPRLPKLRMFIGCNASANMPEEFRFVDVSCLVYSRFL